MLTRRNKKLKRNSTKDRMTHFNISVTVKHLKDKESDTLYKICENRVFTDPYFSA